MRQQISPIKTLVAALAAAAVAGCGSSPPTRLYTLTPMAQPGAPPAGEETKPVSVSVAPVELPDYLDRSQIVTRDGVNGLRLGEFDRWGGSLGENITTVLVENLSDLLASDRIAAWPGLRPETPDFRVGVRILSLDCIPEDRVVLKAQWVVMTGQEKQEVAGGLTTYTEPVKDGSYDSLVAAVSRTVGQLSDEIAQALAAPGATLSAAPRTEGRR